MKNSFSCAACRGRSARFRLLPLLLALLLLLSSCGTEDGSSSEAEDQTDGISLSSLSGTAVTRQTAADDVFSVCYDADAAINPIRAESGTNLLLASLLYDYIFTLDDDLQPVSELIVDYTTTDYSWWVFTIDTSIPFTDGTTLTAKDIVYSIQRAQQSEYYASRLEAVYGCSAMGEDCFAISTAYPDSMLPSLLTIPVIKYGSYNDDVPAGTGPYRLSEDGGSLVLFEENRHASEMPIDTVYLYSYADSAEKISAFETGRIDIVMNDPTGSDNLGYGSTNEVRYYDTTCLHYIGFNMNSPFFQSAVARYAINFAVDRDKLVEEMEGCAVATKLPVWPSSEMYDSDYAEKFSFDLEKTASLFESANVRDHDNDGELEFLVTGIVVEINIDFIVNNNSSAKVIEARQIAEDLNSIGITTTLRELSWDDYLTALEEGDYDMYYGEVRMTADWNLAYLFDEDSDRNYANCYDENFAGLYYDYLAAEPAMRTSAFRDAARYLVENGGIVPLCFERREILTHRGVVSGLQADQYIMFRNFSSWTIDPG